MPADRTPVYDRIGQGYARRRRADPRIEALLREVIGDGARVINVGAGAGSYEPPGTVVAIEPSREMITQRRPGLAPAVQGSAERLPLADDAGDVSLAVLTTHHWRDLDRGLAEMLRVAPRAVILTWDPDVPYWLTHDYLPEMLAWDRERFPPIAAAQSRVVPVPRDCQDGFLAAYWARPRAYLDPSVRAAMSCFAQTDPSLWREGIERLANDLETGAWDRRYAELREAEAIDAGYRLLTLTR